METKAKKPKANLVCMICDAPIKGKPRRIKPPKGTKVEWMRDGWTSTVGVCPGCAKKYA